MQKGAEHLKNHKESLDYLAHLGFPVSPYYRIFDSMMSAFAEVERFAEIREELPFDIDGAVIKVNDFAAKIKEAYQKDLGYWIYSGSELEKEPKYYTAIEKAHKDILNK